MAAPTNRPPAGSKLTEEKFLTAAELAVILRVSKMTVYRLCRSGELESIRVGRSFRIPEAAAEKYIRGTR